jgi:diaminopimelate epimerase
MMRASPQIDVMALSAAGLSRRPTDITLFKYQALGNSYLLFDPQRNLNAIGSIERATDWIRMICSHDYGIGSNGLLVGPDAIANGVFEFRIFNSDGTQVQLSGNGSCIFARYLLDAGYADSAPALPFSIMAISPMLRIVVDVQQPEPDDPCILTTINVVPSFGTSAVEAQPGSIQGSGLHFTVAALADIGRRYRMGGKWVDSSLISIGNPHCVTFVEKPGLLPSVDFLTQLRSEFSVIADATRKFCGPVFRDGCNLQWCFVENRKCIQLRIVERGEGPTLASGSSASAAVIAAYARGLIDEDATVVMPGGMLQVTVLFEDDEICGVRVAGTAEQLAEIRVVSPDYPASNRRPASC